MRIIIFVFTLCLFENINAQSEPQFYIDSEVRTRRMSLSTYAQPMVLFRRIGADLNGTRPQVNSTFRTGPNLDAGISVDFNLGSLRIGTGIGHLWVNYSVNDDIIMNTVSTSARYLSIPFRAGLVTTLNDRVSLEVWPQVIYRQAISYEKDWLIDMVPNYREVIWSAGLNVGPSITVTEYLRWTMLAVIDYGFNDLETFSSDGVVELPIFVGIRTGLRLSI